MKDYRKTWIKHYGPIPIDEDGRTYEIHHINGDRTDNRIENLTCVSIKDHYDLHMVNGDYGAAFRIAQRMGIAKEVKSELASLANKRRSSRGEHPFQDSAIRALAAESVDKRVQRGVQGTQDPEVLQKAIEAKKQKYNSLQLSEFAKKGWAEWKLKNQDTSSRTLPGSKAGSAKTKGTKWYHKPNGEQLRTNPENPRIETEGWIQGRYKGKEISKNAYSYRSNKREK